MEIKVHIHNPSWQFVVYVFKYMTSQFGVDLSYGFLSQSAWNVHSDYKHPTIHVAYLVQRVNGCGKFTGV